MAGKNFLNSLYSVLEETKDSRKLHAVYSWSMLFIILLSIVPLLTRKHNEALLIIDFVTVGIFILDYLLRWITAGCRKENSSWKDYLLYPFTPFAIIDLLSILPTFGLLSSAFKFARFTRLLRLVRILKIIRYSESLFHVFRVIKRESKVLTAVFVISLFYIFISAAIMFCVESEEILPTFFDALYWATSALTTVGYGDVCPVTNIGKAISMISSFFGIAVIALPSGVITAGLLKELGGKDE